MNDLEYYKEGLAQVNEILENFPDISPELRRMLLNNRAYCIKKIKLLEYYRDRRAIIAQN